MRSTILVTGARFGGFTAGKVALASRPRIGWIVAGALCIWPHWTGPPIQPSSFGQYEYISIHTVARNVSPELDRPSTHRLT